MINMEILNRVSNYDTNINVLYSESCKDKALEYDSVLSNMVEYFKGHAKGDIPLSLICLSRVDYNNFSQIPYGLPFVFGTSEQWFISMPGEKEGIIESIINQLLINDDSLEHKFSIEEIRDYISIIGYHEVGHVISHELGIGLKDVGHWGYELLATYLCIVYLRDRYMDKAHLWDKMNNWIMGISHDNKYNTLEEFNSYYSTISGTHPINYLWYQSKFNEMATIIAEKYGLSFFMELREKININRGNTLSIEEIICSICPEFIGWLAEF